MVCDKDPLKAERKKGPGFQTTVLLLATPTSRHSVFWSPLYMLSHTHTNSPIMHLVSYRSVIFMCVIGYLTSIHWTYMYWMLTS